MKRTLIDQKPFEFSARVTLQLGRESISNSTVAISELIKNSYDADATKVNVSFILREHAVSTLLITDDGVGMGPSELVDYWLTVGTNNKSVHSTSSNGRVHTGAKGLGRLGIDRLCKQLVLYTKKAGDDYATQITVNWKKYEQADKKLSEITHNIYKVELPILDKYGLAFDKKDQSGTRMLLIGLKDQWHDQYITQLENELRLLVSPFYAKNEFNITLSKTTSTTNTKKYISSEIILDAAPWKVIANIDEDGNVTSEFYNRKQDTKIKDDPTPWADWIKNMGDKVECGPVKIEFYYIPELKESLNKVDFTKSDFQSFMRNNRGIRIYRDHFRVRPYGEPTGKGDWLDIGIRKSTSPGGIAQGGWKIGPHQIIGAVLISRATNAILNDQANREGIVENNAFYQLRAFILKVISSFEFYAHLDAKNDEERIQKNKAKNNENLELLTTRLEASRQEISKAVEKLKKLSTISGGNNLTPSTNKVIAHTVAKVEKAQETQIKIENELYESIEKYKKKLEEQKDTLTNLASLGILTVCFGHEIRQQTGQMNGNCSLIEIKTSRLIAAHPNINELVEIIKYAQGIQKNVSYVENYSKLALGNIKPDKRTRKKINIPEIFNYVFSLMRESFYEMGIVAKIIPNDEAYLATLSVLSFEIDWESIAINLITNSVWALGPRSKNQRFIEVEFSELENDIFEIKFRDSGIGLEEGSQERIFMPMSSGKRDVIGNVIGTGMGLSIVKNHVENHTNGTVIAKAKSSLGGAEFIFNLPRCKK